MPSRESKHHHSRAPDRSQAAPDRSPAPPVVPAFTRRSPYDPPGISALFAALAIVCALGASAVLFRSDDGNGASWTSAFDNFLGSIGLSRVAAIKPTPWPQTDVTTLERDIGNVATNIDALSTIFDRSASTTKVELLRVRNEIMSLKGELADLRASRDEVTATRDVLARRLASLEATLTKRADHATTGASREPQPQKAEEKTTGASAEPHLGKIEDTVVSAPEVTGSIPAKTAAPAPKPRPMRAWTVRETPEGIVVKGPSGTYRVGVGDFVPGLGRVDEIKRRGARIQLVTRKPEPDAGFFFFFD